MIYTLPARIAGFLKILLLAGTGVYLVLATYVFEGSLRAVEVKAKPKSGDVERLSIALSRNPGIWSNGFRLESRLVQQGETTKALNLLQTSSFGQNHWQGWERQALIQESRLSAASPERAVLEVAQLYDRILRVYPHRIKSIEHRASLAIRLKDWLTAAQLADHLEQIDFNNLSASYLRASLAGELGQTTTALTILKTMSQHKGHASSLFDRKDMINLARRLTGSEPR